jgi:hypothetical protein
MNKKDIGHKTARFAKRIAEKVAPGLSRQYLKRRIEKRTGMRPTGLIPVLKRLQNSFDQDFPQTSNAWHAVARSTSIIVVSQAPFKNVQSIVDCIKSSRDLEIGELVIVDGTAETLAGVAIHSLLRAWRNTLVKTRFKVVRYDRQDLYYAHACNMGVAEASGEHLIVTGMTNLLLPGAVEYLVKALHASLADTVIVARGVTQSGVIAVDEGTPHSVITKAALTVDYAGDFGFSPPVLISRVKQTRIRAIEPIGCFSSAVFGARRELLCSSSSGMFDSFIVADGMELDLSARLNSLGASLVVANAAMYQADVTARRQAVHLWEVIHDFKYLSAKWLKTKAVDAEPIELVCPFHRGDVILATQVAVHVMRSGRRIRLHVADSLVSWARDMCPDLSVESIPVPVAAAQDTFRWLLASYKHVAQRSDASPHIARCHPARGLSGTDQNLLGYMLEEVGLAKDTLLQNSKPLALPEHRQVAEELFFEFGKKVVLIHPFGGWKLKTIPRELIVLLRATLREHGYSLIQIGGADDAQLEGCDGAILRNFNPAQWRPIFELADAIATVDSWSAHFAAILDVPQITFYGSTHPKHVNTKEWFHEKNHPSLALGPTVNCSPCDSLVCTRFPGAARCHGFVFDQTSIDHFIRRLSERTYPQVRTIKPITKGI